MLILRLGSSPPPCGRAGPCCHQTPSAGSEPDLMGNSTHLQNPVAAEALGSEEGRAEARPSSQ